MHVQPYFPAVALLLCGGVFLTGGLFPSRRCFFVSGLILATGLFLGKHFGEVHAVEFAVRAQQQQPPVGRGEGLAGRRLWAGHGSSTCVCCVVRVSRSM